MGLTKKLLVEPGSCLCLRVVDADFVSAYSERTTPFREEILSKLFHDLPQVADRAVRIRAWIDIRGRMTQRRRTGS